MKNEVTRRKPIAGTHATRPSMKVPAMERHIDPDDS